MTTRFWTNPSVLALSGGDDPVEAITKKARAVVFDALERGWKGPPYDPFSLAEQMGIRTMPSADVLDARTVPLSGNRYRIEFNPDRPQRRIRYSVFHELAHTLFPDCGETIRNRGTHTASRPDDRQLETLCNIAAAEFLLPTGSLGTGKPPAAEIDTVLELRERYEASAEAALLRVSRLTSEPAIAFACRRDRATGRYVVDYAAPSPRTTWRLYPGRLLPTGTAAEQCTAIGYTAKQSEAWPFGFGQVRVECVGIAPYPREIFPRVIGFVRPIEFPAAKNVDITYVKGDATELRGAGKKLLTQIVNDTAYTWGAGFAAAVRRRWPAAQKAFTAQAQSPGPTLHLGNVVQCDIEPDVTLLSLIAQRGYGPAPRPRIRYNALRESLAKVCELAKRTSATVHMPRIGTGEAGGSWFVIEELLREVLTRNDVPVVVYDLPTARARANPQHNLPLTR